MIVTARPVLERAAPVPVGLVFRGFGGRMLRVARVHGSDAAAPVICEQLADSAGDLAGQYSLWCVDAVARVVRDQRISP